MELTTIKSPLETYKFYPLPYTKLCKLPLNISIRGMPDRRYIFLRIREEIDQ